MKPAFPIFARSAASRLRTLAIVASLLLTGCQNSILRNTFNDIIDAARGRHTAGHAAYGTRGAVAADHELASRVGVDILRSGGSAVDAAIATSFAVCVVNPSSCGIGGGGFMLIHFAESNTTMALDYRETAPAAATRDMFLVDGKADPEKSRRGGLAVGVPGEVAGLVLLQQRFGTLPLKTLVQPAVALARDGFPAGEHLAKSIAASLDAIRRSPGLAAVFLNSDGSPKRAGDTIRQPKLANTLAQIGEDGARSFYSGAIADDIVRAVRDAGGVLSLTDLATYRPVWRNPLSFEFKGHTVMAMPPPSSAGTLLEVLGMLANDDLPSLAKGAGQGERYLHVLAEAMKHGFADRAKLYGDPSFVDVPVPQLLASTNIQKLRAKIDESARHPHDSYGSDLGGTAAPNRESGTSHLAVIDAQGNAVACTTTINTGFGSMVVGPESGIVLNNEMDDFSAQPGVPNAFGLVGSHANEVAAGKRPLSSMSPTIVLKDGKAVLAAGGSGGPLILSGTLQTLLNALVFDRDAGEAVAAPRIHHQWMPPKLAIESGFAPETIAALEARGHSVAPLPPIGAVQVVRRRENGIEAASDPRKGGVAAAW